MPGNAAPLLTIKASLAFADFALAVDQEITLRGVTGLFGPSGSGKSTLLLMLGGMLSPTSGRVLLKDESIYDLTSNGRARLRKESIGFVFQTFNLVPYLTALENVQVPLFLAHVDEKSQTQRATALLERVGLAERLDHKPTELSVGQQQRVALARMLANDPDVILADEPTGNLDQSTGEDIMEILRTLNKRKNLTIVMVTHDRAIAEEADRIVRLVDGQIAI